MPNSRDIEMTPPIFILTYIILAVVGLQFCIYKIANNDWDKFWYFFFGNLIGLSLISLPMIIILHSMVIATPVYSKIIDVAGCDKRAVCTVKTESGYIAYTQNAFVGSLVEIDRTFKWIWETP